MKRIAILMTFVLQFIWLYGQTVTTPQSPNIIPASPEAAGIAKYLNYPVDYNTGLIGIDIPLHEIKAGEITIPLSLSYHASGLKVYDSNGWLAMGWTVNTLPMISRSVKGIRDDKIRSGYINNDAVTMASLINLDKISKGEYDGEPDEFYYKLLNKSGRFYFSRSGRNISVVTTPYEAVKIEYEKSATELLTFTITDDDGTKYVFSADDREKNYDSVENVYFPSAWRVSRIISPSGADVVTFSYTSSHTFYKNIADRIDVIHPAEGDRPLPPNLYSTNNRPLPLIFENSTFGYTRFHYVNRDANTTNGLKPVVEVSAPYSTPKYTGEIHNIVDTKTLAEIEYRGGSVEFHSSMESTTYGNRTLRFYTLNRINVYNDDLISVKQITFNKSRKPDLPVESAQYELTSVVSADSKYDFEYNTTNRPAPGTSKDIDYWGYYNAANNDKYKSLLPRIKATYNTGTTSGSFSFEIGHANRDAHERSMQAGILKQIKYPTGGVTSFEYEANRFKDGNNQTKMGGGLRIRSIQDYDPVSDKKVYRVFKYGTDGTGIVQYNASTDDCITDNVYRTNANTNQIYTIRTTTYNSEALTDLFYSSGAVVLYDSITEYVSSVPETSPQFISSQLGRTTYKYDCVVPAADRPGRVPADGMVGRTGVFGADVLYIPFFTKTGSAWKYHKLVKKSVYNSTGGLMSESAYQYTPNQKTILNIRKVVKYFTQDSGSMPDTLYRERNGYLVYAPYETTGVSKLTREITTEYRQGTPLVLQKDYSYDLNGRCHLMASEESSPGNVVKKEFKYPYSSGISGTVYTSMVTRNMVSPVIEERTWVNGTESKKIRTNYKTERGFILPQSIVNSYGGATSTTAISFDAYTDQGKLRQYTRSDGMKVTYIWGYNGQYPIAEIINKAASQVWAVLPESTVKAIEVRSAPDSSQWSKIAALRNTLPDAHVTIFKYNPPIGVTEITDPGGITMYYEYDGFGRLKESYYKEGSAKRILENYEYKYKNQ